MMHPAKHQKIRRGLIVFLTAAMFALTALPDAMIADASDKGYGGIKPIPGTKHYELGHDFRKDVEKRYHHVGIVDDVQAEGIVVNDSYFKKAPGAIIRGASKGARVGLIFNEARELVLCEPYRENDR